MMQTITHIWRSLFKTRYSNKSGIPCGYCNVHIFKEHEAGGFIHYSAEGKPICARDRILRGSMGAIIKDDKGKRDAQLAEIEKRAQARADEEAIRVAGISQELTDTKRK